ncbi:zinc-dependent metalloprotease [Gelidibacter maritimus]|uniref:Proprotein convertase P-domain-containing protein n=1 Tax=Gelidibacter maritimus TaxID=2761487 RepID=A0A7W2M2W4_9FLAO|nr:zinc-dependent metalloprotease family protein [Gelidibacter maritimus]MBA6151713.1 proprotein convertase P-domain-containing protein [Gelidibacter maritimus]
MKNNYLKFSLFLIVILTFSMTYGQKSESLWTKTTKTSVSQQRLLPQNSTPTKAQYYQLNMEGLKSRLKNAPERDSASSSRTLIDFPNSEGDMETFRVMKYTVMHPELQAKFPDIRSYVGYGLKNSSTVIYFSVSPDNVHTMTMSVDRGTEFINPYATDGTYEVFSKNSLTMAQSLFECGVVDDGLPNNLTLNLGGVAARNANDGTRRTFRLAVGTSIEYTNFHGGSVASAMAAINTTMTRVNGIYDRELSIRMTLIANNDLLISTTGNSIFPNAESVSSLTTTFNGLIGADNYDIGHTFTTGSGGAAYLGSVCSANKGGGTTGLTSPTGDPFAIDYVSHEIAHQFGASHTFNGSAGNCGAGNRTTATAYEPGSGSTILSYAGICGSQNVQNNSSDYFHQASLRQIWTYITTGAGSCGVLSATGNTAPTADAGASYQIPVSTPFRLTGSSADIDGTATHTFTWEQFDLGSAGMPTETTEFAPVVRSFLGTPNPVRYIPRLQDVLANGGSSTTWEKLPSVSRILNFVLTVRDNDVRGGQTAVDNMAVTTVATGGPFKVTSQASNVTWEIGATKTVTWDVANTNIAPINTTNVNIKLSVDGGATFPHTLASNVPNNGAYEVLVPQVANTTEARVMVESVGNIFYNVNVSNFEIVTVDYLLNFSTTSVTVCQPDDIAVYDFVYNTYGGYAQNTTFSAVNLPAGTTATFSPSSASANNTPVTMTLTGVSGALLGDYDISAVGTSGSVTNSSTVTLSVFSNTIDPPTLSTPANGTAGLYSDVELSWEIDANVENYLIEIATDSNFSDIVDSQTITSNSYAANLALETVYYWRVTGSNRCSIGTTSSISSFGTGVSTCEGVLTASDTPIVISATGSNVYNSVITVTEDLPVTDVNVKVNITHAWVRDIKMVLISPTGTRVVLSNNNGADATQNYTNTVFDQEATNSIVGEEAPFTGSFIPEEDLSVIYGEMSAGNWTLEVTDLFDGDGGSLDEFTLELCLSQPLSVEENNFDAFAIFPNPNNGDFTIKLQSHSGLDINVVLYDIRGRKVLENRFKNTSNFREIIQLDHAESGMYLINISDGLKSVTKKIIVH